MVVYHFGDQTVLALTDHCFPSPFTSRLLIDLYPVSLHFANPTARQSLGPLRLHLLRCQGGCLNPSLPFTLQLKPVAYNINLELMSYEWNSSPPLSGFSSRSPSHAAENCRQTQATLLLPALCADPRQQGRCRGGPAPDPDAAGGSPGPDPPHRQGRE